jgi:glutaredoxin
MRAVVLYGRPGCHLCDDARSVLEAAGIAFEEVDISRDPALEAEYGVLVPVVEVGGREVFEAGMNPRELPRLVRASRSAGR